MISTDIIFYLKMSFLARTQKSPLQHIYIIIYIYFNAIDSIFLFME